MFRGIVDLLKGNVKALNPELPIDEQMNLLPYEKMWEFPRKRLRLG